MKKALFVWLLCLPFLAWGDSLDDLINQKELQAIVSAADLDANLKVGYITVGDSVTHYLFGLELLKDRGQGDLTCKVDDFKLPGLMVGDDRPIEAYVVSEGYKVKTIQLEFEDSRSRHVYSYLYKHLGRPASVLDDGYAWNFNNCNVLYFPSDASRRWRWVLDITGN